MSVSVKGQPWLESQATRAVMRALEAAGGAGCARFVGGCVRNSLLGQPVDDIDIATRLRPEQTMAALKAAGRIVFVGEAETRIREDYLRILRFFRFYAWYGRGEPDAVGLAACAALKGGMAQLSAERVSKELLKLLAAPDPRAAVQAMADTGVLAQVLPQAQPLALFEAICDLTDDPVMRLSALLPADVAEVMEIAVGLRLSNAVRDRLAAAVADGPAVSPTMSDAEARAAIYRLGRRAFEDRLMRAEAAGGGDGARLQALSADWTPPKMPVGGRDLARLGLRPGPETGRVLKAFEDGWVADDFPGEGHERRLKTLIAATGRG